MDFKELTTKSASELQAFVTANREKLRELRFKDSSRQLKNVREIRATRVLMAQALTLLNKKK